MDYIITGMALLFPIALYIAVTENNEKERLRKEVEWLNALLDAKD